VKIELFAGGASVPTDGATHSTRQLGEHLRVVTRDREAAPAYDLRRSVKSEPDFCCVVGCVAELICGGKYYNTQLSVQRRLGVPPDLPHWHCAFWHVLKLPWEPLQGGLTRGGPFDVGAPVHAG
jgi:hypothetical protein